MDLVLAKRIQFKGFTLGGVAKESDAALESKMPAFQEFIKPGFKLLKQTCRLKCRLLRIQLWRIFKIQQISGARENYNVVLETTQGDITIELIPSIAPLAVANFSGHIENGYYNDLIFHRVIKDFMIQGGDPIGTGAGGESIWKKNFPDEFSEELRFDTEGLIAMANSGPMTNGSQFLLLPASLSGSTTSTLFLVKLSTATTSLRRSKPLKLARKISR